MSWRERVARLERRTRRARLVAWSFTAGVICLASYRMSLLTGAAEVEAAVAACVVALGVGLLAARVEP